MSHTCNLNSSAAAAPGATISWAVNQKISKTTSHSFEELAPRPQINVCFSLKQEFYESRHHTKITYAIPPHQEKTTDAYSQHCRHGANYTKIMQITNVNLRLGMGIFVKWKFSSA